MAVLTKMCPTFPSQDFDRTEGFYARLGFKRISRYEEEGYLLIARDDQELHFWRKPDHDAASSEFMTYVRVDDAAELSRQFEAAFIDGPPPAQFAPAEDKPWGMHELSVVDPDGNLLRIGTELPSG